jgi:hypothetical protein
MQSITSEKEILEFTNLRKKLFKFKIFFQFIWIECVELLLPIKIQQNPVKPMKEYKGLSKQFSINII